MSNRLLGISALVLLQFVGSGCSLLFVDGPPRQELWEVPSVADPAQCTESYALPILDTVAVPASVFSGLVSNDEIIFLSGVGWALVHLASAWSGYANVNECNDFMDAKTARLLQSATSQYYLGGSSDAKDFEVTDNMINLHLQNSETGH